MTGLGAARYRTASEHAFRVIKQWILEGGLAPGSPIDQAEVGARLGMSRMPIRTALERLDSEGLVLLAPHRGAIVSPMSVRELRELYLVRCDVEALATELAVANLSEENLNEIGRLLQLTEANVGTGDLEAFLTNSRLFHMAIYARANNAILRRVIESLWDLSERYRRAYLELPTRANASTSEHRRIYELLRARNAHEAAALVREHNARAMCALERNLAENAEPA